MGSEPHPCRNDSHAYLRGAHGFQSSLPVLPSSHSHFSAGGGGGGGGVGEGAGSGPGAGSTDGGGGGFGGDGVDGPAARVRIARTKPDARFVCVIACRSTS